MNIFITEDYDKQCGEVFLTVNGNLVVHCTLCETKFYGFTEYAQHVHENHFMAKDESNRVQYFENDAPGLSPKTNEATETSASLVSEE